MRLNLRRLVLVAALVLAAASVLLYLNLVFPSYGYAFRYANACDTRRGGARPTREIA